MSVLGMVGQRGTASAKEIRFIAHEPVSDRAIWSPGAVKIDQKKDLKEPLFFILENPTGADHDFAVHGLYAILPEEIRSGMRSEYFTGPKTDEVLKPIHVLVKAKSTVKIHVSTEGLIGDKDLGAKYSFFCPMHKDLHLGGVILVD
jgi:hypothetical protein